MFRAFGHTNSSVLDGGLPRWEAEDLPVEAAEAENTSNGGKADYPTPTYDTAVVRSAYLFEKSYLEIGTDDTCAL